MEGKTRLPAIAHFTPRAWGCQPTAENVIGGYALGWPAEVNFAEKSSCYLPRVQAMRGSLEDREAHAQGTALHRHLRGVNNTSKRKNKPKDWHLLSITHYLCTARRATSKMEAFLGPRHFCCLRQVAGVHWLCRKGREGMDAGCCVRAGTKRLLLTGWKSFTWDTSGWKRSNWRGVCRYVRGQGEAGKDWNTPLVLPASIGLWCYRKLFC